MKLSLITNDENLIKHSKKCDIDRIMIDLEYLGKKERQSGKKLFQSTHSLEDVKKIKKIDKKINLLVRVNSINKNSEKEISEVIDNGADIIMLPFFKTLEEVTKFINFVNGQIKICLLIETKESLEFSDELIKIKEIDEFHIGLNDLSLSLKTDNIFELILDGTISECLEILKKSGKPFGFGGVGSLKNQTCLINPELFLFEQLKNSCQIGWLGRSFRDLIHSENDLCENVKIIRESILKYTTLSDTETTNLSTKLFDQIKSVTNQINKNHKKYRI